jgi:hypothetical protein
MDKRVHALFADRESSDRSAAYQAVGGLFEMTNRPVAWAYDVWDQLVADLKHSEGHTRAFAAQMLVRLAISDSEGRILRDFKKVAAVMKDGKPVTARHTLQSLWRVGLAGPKHAALVLRALEARFTECEKERGGRIARTDVITSIGTLAKATGDTAIEARANALIESETDENSRKKQRSAWRNAVK